MIGGSFAVVEVGGRIGKYLRAHKGRFGSGHAHRQTLWSETRWQTMNKSKIELSVKNNMKHEVVDVDLVEEVDWIH
jgi:hypothetical protein